jgi:mannose-6-phosphate isomerase-like protein (cupin superfamily)
MRRIQVGEWIENPLAGLKVCFTLLPQQTAGERYEAEFVNQPFTGKGAAPLHLHPTITETFTVIAGRACYRLQGREYPAGPGQQIVLPPDVPHLHPWSVSAEELRMHLVAECAPADLDGLNRIMNSVITSFGLARDGKTNKSGGQPRNLLQAAVIGDYVVPGFYPAGLPIPLTRFVIGGLAVLGRAMGFRPTDEVYGEI